MTIPAVFEWTDDGVMKPLGHFSRLCDKQFVVGLKYKMDVIADRSSASHRHYMASVTEAFANIPEQHANRWPSPDHLRKWALIKSGFYHEDTFTCATKAEAMRWGANMRALDDYSEVIVEGRTVSRRTAKSQSYTAMERKEFQESKDLVLALLSELIGVTPEELKRNAEQAA